MRVHPASPTAALLNLSLVIGPLLYLFLDTTYSVRGWWDADTGALHMLAAGVYGLTALRLVTLLPGRLQPVLLGVAVLGIIGNAGVGENTLHVGLGGADLFQEGGPANLFKTLGFFFPLTFLVAAAGLRGRLPSWNVTLLALGAIVFPVAHVANISWLAILDGVVMVVALGQVFARRRHLDELVDPEVPVLAPVSAAGQRGRGAGTVAQRQ